MGNFRDKTSNNPQNMRHLRGIGVKCLQQFMNRFRDDGSQFTYKTVNSFERKINFTEHLGNVLFSCDILLKVKCICTV